MTWSEVILGNYGTPRLEIVAGEGCFVSDAQGKKYLDLLSGIAVSSLGHSHPAIVNAITQQAKTLIHTSNLYAHPRAIELAEKLLKLADSKGKVFFSQDGATANEAAIKIARRYGADKGKAKFVAMNNGFHGRTMGALAVTGNPAKREPFAPFGIDVTFIDYGDVDQLKAAVDQNTCAVILEPTQGEGGMVVPPAGFLKAVREVTQLHGALMIVDEVQSGIGRSGHWFDSIAQGVRPDIITLAKGLAGGMPLGAAIVEPIVVDALKPGDHGTTFGGNEVSCASALAVIATIENENLLLHVRSTGDWLRAQLLTMNLNHLVDVRGSGLWFGLVFDRDIAADIERMSEEKGFLVNAVKPNVIRLAPPLVITQQQLQTFLDVLPAILGGVR